MPTRRKKSGDRRYGEAASKSVESAMRRKKRGTLKSGKGGRGGRVKSREQAIAIGLSEAREKGAKVPPRKGSSSRGRSSRSTSRSPSRKSRGSTGSTSGRTRRGSSSRSRPSSRSTRA